MSAITPIKLTAAAETAPSTTEEGLTTDKRVARCALTGHKAALRSSSTRLCAAAAASEAAHSLAAGNLAAWQAAPLASLSPMPVRRTDADEIDRLNREKILELMTAVNVVTKPVHWAGDFVVDAVCKGPISESICGGVKTVAVGTGRLIKACLPDVIKDPLKAAVKKVQDTPGEWEKGRYKLPAAKTEAFINDLAALGSLVVGGTATKALATKAARAAADRAVGQVVRELHKEGSRTLKESLLAGTSHKTLVHVTSKGAALATTLTIAEPAMAALVPAEEPLDFSSPTIFQRSSQLAEAYLEKMRISHARKAVDELGERLQHGMSLSQDRDLYRYAAASSKNKGGTVIYAVAADDWNGAFRACGKHKPIKELVGPHRRLVFERVSSASQIRDLIKENRDISHVWITAHGNEKTMHFSTFNTVNGDSLTRGWPLDHFRDGAQVILDSCRTASEYKGPSFAYHVQKALGDKIGVVAPRYTVSSRSPVVAGDTIIFGHSSGAEFERVMGNTNLVSGDATVRLHYKSYESFYEGIYSKFFASNPKEFNGALAKDLVLVQYHGENKPWNHFVRIAEANKMATVDAVRDRMAILNRARTLTHVTVARIPAGEAAKFYYGKAAPKMSKVGGEVRPGGATVLRFYDVNPKWVVETRKLPTGKEPSKFREFDARATALASRPTSFSSPVVLKQQQIPPSWLGESASSATLKRGAYCIVRDGAAKYISLHIDGLYANGEKGVLRSLVNNLIREIHRDGVTGAYLLTEIRNPKLRDLLVTRFGLRLIEKRGMDGLYEIPGLISEAKKRAYLPVD